MNLVRRVIIAEPRRIHMTLRIACRRRAEKESIVDRQTSVLFVFLKQLKTTPT